MGAQGSHDFVVTCRPFRNSRFAMETVVPGMLRRPHAVRPSLLLHVRAVPTLLALCLGSGLVHAQTVSLGDSDIAFRGVATSGSASDCKGDAWAGPDCHDDRHVASAAGSASKVSQGAPDIDAVDGFDYTKISNSGAALGNEAALGSGPDDWACTRDDVTGLIWELKTADGGLRDKRHTYTWYDSVYGGTADGGKCYVSGRCDTEKYIADINALPQRLCGANDWRLPSHEELLSIVGEGRFNPAGDRFFFPDTSSSFFRSRATYAYRSGSAWFLHFSNGYSYSNGRSVRLRVRAVRGGAQEDTRP